MGATCSKAQKMEKKLDNSSSFGKKKKKNLDGSPLEPAQKQDNPARDSKAKEGDSGRDPEPGGMPKITRKE